MAIETRSFLSWIEAIARIPTYITKELITLWLYLESVDGEEAETDESGGRRRSRLGRSERKLT